MFSARFVMNRVSAIRPSNLTASRLPFVNYSTQFPRSRFFSSKPVRSIRKQETPKVRYLFYMFLVSCGALYFVGNSVDKKQKPKTSFDSEREFREYEESTGLKRRNKLINFEKNEHYKFYVIPYVHLDETVDKIAARLKQIDDSKQVKIIDPKKLVEQEKQDEDRKYCYLLQDLDAAGKSYPKGLITALVKQEVKMFLNTRMGTFDTNIIIKNFPQTTEDAIKFENEVSDVQKCLIVHYDMLNELKRNNTPEAARSIENVVGYFETVGRVKTLTSKKDELDDKLKELMLEDL